MGLIPVLPDVGRHLQSFLLLGYFVNIWICGDVYKVCWFFWLETLWTQLDYLGIDDFFKRKSQCMPVKSDLCVLRLIKVFLHWWHWQIFRSISLSWPQNPLSNKENLFLKENVAGTDEQTYSATRCSNCYHYFDKKTGTTWEIIRQGSFCGKWLGTGKSPRKYLKTVPICSPLLSGKFLTVMDTVLWDKHSLKSVSAPLVYRWSRPGSIVSAL